MASYPSNALDDGELTDHELRRLIHEIVRERMRVVTDAHLADYWAARVRDQRSGSKPTLRPYDPSELHDLRSVLTAEVRQEVLDFRRLDLTEVSAL